MAIECSPAPSVHKNNEAHASKAKAKPDAAGAGDAATGFAALLNLADASTASSPDSQSGGADTVEDPVAAGAATATAEPGALNAQDATALMAAYLQPQTAVLPAVQTIVAKALPSTTTAVTAAVAGTTDAAKSALAKADDGLTRLPAELLADITRAGAAEGPTGASSLANYASVFEQLQSRLAHAAGGTDAPNTNTKADAPQLLDSKAAKPTAGLLPVDARADRLAGLGQAGSVSTRASEASVTVALQADAVDTLKSIDRPRDESPRASTNVMPDGAGRHAFTPTVQYDGAAMAAPATADMSSANGVAEQVGYWISQGVQNAEITMDGANADRVQVSISMSGNEAHVEFRADQAATREMLAGSASQLKELLSSQGMVLSGMTVGHSGAGAAGGQQNNRSGGRQDPQRGGSAEKVSAPAATPTRAANPTGMLDLFV